MIWQNSAKSCYLMLGEIGNSLNEQRSKKAQNKVPQGTAPKPQIRSARAG